MNLLYPDIVINKSLITTNKIIFILGMHRSGTSAVTRMLNILGIDLGKNLLKGQTAINEKGFWENKNLIEIHDKIFSYFDSTWFDVRSLPENWWLNTGLKPYIHEIESVLENDFENMNVVALKDPRLCRFMPLWLNIIQTHHISPMCLLMLRNPGEVAKSLTKRDGFDKGTGFYLWLIYVLESEYYSRGLPRTVLRYDDLLNDWEKSANLIAKDLNIQWPESLNDVSCRMSEELSVKLRHHYDDVSDKSIKDELENYAYAVYEKMSLFPLDDKHDYYDDLRCQLWNQTAFSKSLTETIHKSNSLISQQTKKLIEIGKLHSDALAYIDSITSHWLWKFAKFFLRRSDSDRN